MEGFSAYWNVYIIVVLSCCITVSEALICYSCENIKNNEQCFNVTSCSQNDVCFAKSDGFDSGEVTHSLGCRSLQSQGVTTTSSPGQYTFCNHICQESLCNLHLCTPKKNYTRGSRCLKCDVTDDPAKCDHVTVCNKNQMCGVKSFVTYGQKRFRLGCIDKTFCGNHVPTPVDEIAVGKRVSQSDTSCSLCCSGDHCNMFACKDLHRDNGDVRTLTPLNHPECNDEQPSTCSTFGLLSKDACTNMNVRTSCAKSCELCEQVSWSAWHSWSPCTQSCGTTGTKARTRDCIHQFDVLKNIQCHGLNHQTTSCNRKHCPVDGGWCVHHKQCCIYEQPEYTRSCWECGHSTCECPRPAYGGKTCS